MLPRSVVTNVADALQREWLVTNGIGGFAAGTVSQANTRRYHGLLIASLRPPVERVLMVSKIDTTVGYQGRVSELSCNEFADGTIAPRGCQLLSSFRLENQVPTWTYRIGDAVLEQRLGWRTARTRLMSVFRLPIRGRVGRLANTRRRWRTIATGGATAYRVPSRGRIRAQLIARANWPTVYPNSTF